MGLRIATITDIEVMPRRLELVAGVSVVAWNVLVYAVVIWLAR